MTSNALPPDLDIIITNPATRFRLERMWDKMDERFDYVLVESNTDLHIMLSRDLGRSLATNWEQTEYGTFIGLHNMEWILAHMGGANGSKHSIA